MNEEIIKKWLEGTLSEEEKERLGNSEEFKTLRSLLESSKAFKAPAYNVENELKRFSSENYRASKVVKMNWTRVILQTAAVVALLAVAWWYMAPGNIQTYQTSAGEKLEFYLPDSSMVFLNASSKLDFNSSDWTSNRIVTLQGEAYFKVRKGSKFEVSSTQGIVSVLGTEFNVKTRKNYYEVVCYEGLVRVSSSIQTVELSANDLFRLINDTFSQDKHRLDSPSWIADESRFISVPLIEVFNEFERQYGVRLSHNSIAIDQLFSGSFAHNDLPLALQAITLPMNIRYEIVDDQTIVLTGDLE